MPLLWALICHGHRALLCSPSQPPLSKGSAPAPQRLRRAFACGGPCSIPPAACSPKPRGRNLCLQTRGPYSGIVFAFFFPEKTTKNPPCCTNAGMMLQFSTRGAPARCPRETALQTVSLSSLPTYFAPTCKSVNKLRAVQGYLQKVGND